MPVYMIQAMPSGNVKIGWTAYDPDLRLRRLKTGTAEDVSVLRIIDAPIEAEEILQRYFAADHIKREWFRFNPEMLTVPAPAIEPKPSVVRPSMRRTDKDDRNISVSAIREVITKHFAGHKIDLAASLGVHLDTVERWLSRADDFVLRGTAAVAINARVRERKGR